MPHVLDRARYDAESVNDVWAGMRLESIDV